MYHLFLYLLYQTLKYYILLLPNGAYRTKSVCKNPYNTSKYLVL